jgi:hypothetical protein
MKKKIKNNSTLSMFVTTFFLKKYKIYEFLFGLLQFLKKNKNQENKHLKILKLL